MKVNGGVEEGRKRGGEWAKKKRKKVRGGGYRVGERGRGKEKERGRVGRWINRR
jgi:hypothetical protein